MNSFNIAFFFFSFFFGIIYNSHAAALSLNIITLEHPSTCQNHSKPGCTFIHTHKSQDPLDRADTKRGGLFKLRTLGLMTKVELNSPHNRNWRSVLHKATPMRQTILGTQRS